MKPARILALITGSLLVLPALAATLSGAVLGVAYLVARDDDGYFDHTIRGLSTPTAALTAEDIELGADPGSPQWLIDALDTDVRLRVTSADSGADVFVGIAAERDVDRFLAGVPHAEVEDLDDDLDPVLRTRAGDRTPNPPTEETFWTASASGVGTQELTWEATDGRWSVVVMNSQGTPGVDVDVNVGAKADFILPLAVGLLGAGSLVTLTSVAFIIIGATGSRSEVEPAVGVADEVSPAPRRTELSPVALSARLDPELSRWKWLVKWVLAIPHYIVLIFLWIAFAVLTLVAAVAILFTGRYPRAIFDFNVGVLRWGWRVSYYSATGGLGTDQYPPFSLDPSPSDPARLDIAYPERLSRPLVLVKWLLAIPHLIIVGLLAGTSIRWFGFDGDVIGFDPTGGGGLLGILVLIAGVILLFSGSYPRSLFELIVGLNRWIYRAVAYVALMTDQYPPFRLDQGGEEPGPDPTPPPSPGPSALDLRPQPDFEPVG